MVSGNSMERHGNAISHLACVKWWWDVHFNISFLWCTYQWTYQKTAGKIRSKRKSRSIISTEWSVGWSRRSRKTPVDYTVPLVLWEATLAEEGLKTQARHWRNSAMAFLPFPCVRAVVKMSPVHLRDKAQSCPNIASLSHSPVASLI